MYCLDNGDAQYGQPLTYFAPELVSKESIEQLADEVKASCDDSLRVYTFVTFEKIQHSNIVVSGSK